MSVSTQCEFSFVLDECPWIPNLRLVGTPVVLPTYSAADVKKWKHMDLPLSPSLTEALQDMKNFHGF